MYECMYEFTMAALFFCSTAPVISPQSPHARELTFHGSRRRSSNQTVQGSNVSHADLPLRVGQHARGGIHLDT